MNTFISELLLIDKKDIVFFNHKNETFLICYIYNDRITQKIDELSEYDLYTFHKYALLDPSIHFNIFSEVREHTLTYFNRRFFVDINAKEKPKDYIGLGSYELELDVLGNKMTFEVTLSVMDSLEQIKKIKSSI